jgi:MOSC domain-containing protein YiiM
MDMLEGTVVTIYISPARGEPTVSVDQVHVIPGKGIQGDRYFSEQGKVAEGYRPDRQLTLIESEAIEAIRQEDGIPISPGDTRRNIITRGIRLNDLVGYDFYIGKIRMHGIRLCEPCNYLASRTHPQIITSMAHRGGLRAEILSDGMIHINDIIAIADKEGDL